MSPRHDGQVAPCEGRAGGRPAVGLGNVTGGPTDGGTAARRATEAQDCLSANTFGLHDESVRASPRHLAHERPGLCNPSDCAYWNVQRSRRSLPRVSTGTGVQMRQAARRAGGFAASEKPVTASSVEKRLWCMEGFAWLHGPGLFGHRAQRSFDIWNAAEARAVVPLMVLREIHTPLTSRRSRCVTYAFWTQDPPSMSVEHLVARTASVDDAAIRRVALPYAGLSPWRGPARLGSAFGAASDEVARMLSNPSRGMFVLNHVDTAGRPTSALGLWARLDGVDYVHPVRGDLTC